MSIPTSAVIRIILGQPDRLDRQGQPDPVPGLAELLELHGWSVTGKLGTWSTTLTRPGDQPGSRRPPSDEALLRLLDGDDEQPGDSTALDSIADRLRSAGVRATTRSK